MAVICHLDVIAKTFDKLESERHKMETTCLRLQPALALCFTELLYLIVHKTESLKMFVIIQLHYFAAAHTVLQHLQN